MTVQELIAKIRKIEIRTKTQSNHIFAGQHHTAFKGKGMSFSEVREYQYGDDVRAIDWNVSARFAHPYIKVFEEERELEIMLVIDISNSMLYGTQQQSKKNMAIELAATIAFSALRNNDKVGALFVADGVQHYIPAKKGKAHVLLILRKLLHFTAQQSHKTDLANALQMVNNITKHKTVVFIISDFICQNFEKQLHVCSQRNEVVGIQLFDVSEIQMPNVGLLPVQDLETNNTEWVDTNKEIIRKQLATTFNIFLNTTKQKFTAINASYISCATNQDAFKLLYQYFEKK
jgi:uncharacterized protein (DUF58 family)